MEKGKVGRKMTKREGRDEKRRGKEKIKRGEERRDESDRRERRGIGQPKTWALLWSLI